MVQRLAYSCQLSKGTEPEMPQSLNREDGRFSDCAVFLQVFTLQIACHNDRREAQSTEMRHQTLKRREMLMRGTFVAGWMIPIVFRVRIVPVLLQRRLEQRSPEGNALFLGIQF